MKETNRIDFDGAWKEVLEFYFQPFMQFCFPKVAELIDWSKKFVFLDKELQKIASDSQTGKRYVDKLIKVFFLSGEEEWILVHVEIQNQKDPELPARMLNYHTRARDHFRVNVTSLAVLTDDIPDWRPSKFKIDRRLPANSGISCLQNQRL